MYFLFYSFLSPRSVEIRTLTLGADSDFKLTGYPFVRAPLALYWLYLCLHTVEYNLVFDKCQGCGILISIGHFSHPRVGGFFVCREG